LNKPKIFAFDVLAFDDKSLCHLPLFKRRQYLERLIDDELVLRAHTVDLTGEYIEESISIQAELAKEAGVEGLIVKSLEMPYETSGKRVNTWLKLKNMALSGGMRDTLDLVPIGAFYGRGNRTGKFGSFLMASYN